MANIFPSGQIKTVLETFKDASWSIRYTGYFLAFGFGAKAANDYYFQFQVVSQQLDRLVVIISFFMLLAGGLYREITIRRDRRFASMQKDAHWTLHRIRDLTSFLDSWLDQIEKNKLQNPETLANVENLAKRSLTDILDCFANCFRQISGLPCRATIKGIFEHDNNYYAYTIARDADSQIANEKYDAERQMNCSDSLAENEDFEIIMNDGSGDRWFFDGFLPSRPDYLNSHDPGIKSRRNTNRRYWWNRFFPRSGWNLPYVSTIVWPIQQKAATGLEFPPMGCIGFLAVDADRKNAFSDRFDTHFGAGIADSLFHAVDKLSRLTEEIEKLKQEEKA